MSKGTYVLDSVTCSIAWSKECRGGVAVDVVEEVCDFDSRIQSLSWCLNGGDLGDLP